MGQGVPKLPIFRQSYLLESFEVMTRKMCLGQARTQFSNSMAIGTSLESLPLNHAGHPVVSE
jgi:hypothetical protein